MDEKIHVSLPMDFEISTGNSQNSVSTTITCSTFEDEEEWTEDDWGEDPMEEEKWEDEPDEEDENDDDDDDDEWDEDWDDDDWGIDIDENSSNL